MAVRPIDGDALRKELTCNFAGEPFHGNRKVTIGEVRRIIESMPTLTPPNEPLTIEKLREMEGQWIIIKAFDAEISGIMPAFIKDQFATTLCELGSKAIIPDLCEAHFSFNEYGKTWIAYDRPPEGEEDT